MSILSVEANGFVAIFGVIVLAIASLVGLVLFVNKEETFEDVVAAQKKEQEALLNSLQGAKSGKSHKKWSKRKSKKAIKKEGEEHDADSGVDDDEPSSESIAAPIITVEQELPQQKSSKKKTKSNISEQPSKQAQEPSKQIQESSKQAQEPLKQAQEPLKQAQEPSKQAQEPSKQVEDKKQSPLPSKEKKLKVKKVVSEDVVVQNPLIQDTECEVESNEIFVPLASLPNGIEKVSTESKISPTTIPLFNASKDIENAQKKKTNKTKTNKTVQSSSNDSWKGVEMNSDKLIKDIEAYQLNALEVQQIIDMLLAKQNELEQWKKPNQKADPVEQLKKDLNDIELKLIEERKITQSTVLKNKELKIELQQQKQIIQNQANEKFKQQAMEHELIRKKMEEKYVSEMQRMQLQIKQMQELIDNTSQSDYHQMKEENNHLKNATLRAQQLAEDNKVLMSELNQLQQNNKKCRADLDNTMIQLKQNEQQQKSMHDRIVFYESEIKITQLSMKETEKSLTQRIQEVNNELSKVEAYNRSLILELDQAKKLSEKSIIEKEVIQQRFSSSDEELNRLRSQLSDNEAKLSEAMKNLEKFTHEKHSENDQYQTKLSDAEINLKELEKVKQRVVELESKLAEDTQSKVESKLAELNQLKTKLTESEKKIEELSILNAKLSEAESKLNEANQLHFKLSEMESKLADAEKARLLMESQLTESNIPIDTTNEIKKYQDELTAVHEKMQLLITSAAENHTSSTNEVTDLNKKIIALEQEIKDFKIMHESKTKLEEELKEIKESNKKKEEIINEIKAKNNELREKNWKAMDALGKSEEESHKKVKQIEQSLFKGLKKLHPTVKLPSLDDNIDDFFTKFEQSYLENSQSEHAHIIDELKQAKIENANLIQELSELKTKEISTEDYQKSKSENAHLRNVLAETETMLSHLQENVDAEVIKWQRKVDLKDAELCDIQAKLKKFEENDKSSQLELQLKDISAQLDLEKKEVINLHEKLEAVTNKLEASVKAETELEEKLKAQVLKENASELDELNSKLKKTVSERDLLIREFKTLKEKHAQQEKDVSAVEAAKKTLKDQHAVELKKLQDQVFTLTSSSPSKGKGDKQKDELIEKLNLEIQKLKEDLQEARDQVIVDMEPAGAEDLHKQVDNLAVELQSEKKSKLELSMKLEDLERSFQGEQSDKDKLLNVESKLKAAEARIKELEAIHGKQVEKQIADAMKNVVSDIGTRL